MTVPTDRNQPLLEPGEAEHRARLQAALGPDYAILDLLGQGGMGSVYLARDHRLDRDVAVKALRHDVFPTRVVLERFQREAKALARLRHPNILPVYAVGEGDGLAYMITPYIRGMSLRGCLDRDGALPVSDATRIAVAIARALDGAHQLGIIHRDVKPDNILLESDELHPLLADFGIAKSHSDDQALTASGMILGSPRYMSPEQTSGERDIDQRADIYALGAVTYEMLAGRPPYDGANFQQLVVQQMTTAPAALISVAPGVPEALSAAVMRSLARDPSDRWRSALEFAEALSALDLSPGVAVASASRSWLDKRGIAVALLLFVSQNLLLTGVALADASPGRQTSVLVDVVIRPVVLLCAVLVAALLVEAVVIFAVARRRVASWGGAARAVFGQPRWWLAWYPRSLRGAHDSWDRMLASVKTLRTMLFVGCVAAPFVLPLVYVIPRLAGVLAGANVAFALPVRVVLHLLYLLRDLGALLIASLFLGIPAVAIHRRVSIKKVFRAVLFGDDLR